MSHGVEALIAVVRVQVCKYVCESVLPALDVRWGPTHTEVINTPGTSSADGNVTQSPAACNSSIWVL
jgi:hypothetical protein